MLEHTRHIGLSALTVAQKLNDTFLRNSIETKKLREQTTHLCNELKTFSKSRKINIFNSATKSLQ